MPGYIIHLTEAKLILECLKKMYDTRSVFSDQWTQCFFWGSLLPDAADKTQKCKSHFWKEGQEEKILRFPQTEWFLEKYQTRLEDPVILGYYAHLYLDRMFFSDFLTAFVSFYDAAGNKTDRISEVSWAVIQKNHRKAELLELFSKEYLYGDYTKLNRYLSGKYLKNFPIEMLKEFNLQKIPLKEAEGADMASLCEELQWYLRESARYDSHEKMELKILETDSLERFLKDTAERFVRSFCSGC